MGSTAGAVLFACGVPGKGEANPAYLLLGAIITTTLLIVGYCVERAANVLPKGRLGGMIGLLFVILCFGAVLKPVFDGARMAASATQCLSNVKELSQGLFMYSDDHDTRLPPARTWSSASAGYRGAVPKCMSTSAPYTYGFNKALGGLPQSEFDYRCVMLFEIDSETANPIGGQADVALRHGGRSAFGMMDSSAKRSQNVLNWVPKP
jgi:hypothetical protein